jgi:outer membrane lipoprotein SlyB
MENDLSKMSIVELEGLKKTLIQQNIMIGFAGGVAGLIYANRTGGGFWRYVGYWVVGGIAVGFIPRIAYFVPKTNKVDAMILTKKTTNTNTINK